MTGLISMRKASRLLTTIPPGDLWAAVAALPKIELHRHLEGSLRLETLAELTREHSLDMPGRDVEGLRPHVQVVGGPPGFSDYLGKFRLLRHFYLCQDVVMRLAYECVADTAQDNVKYMELRFSPVALSTVQGFQVEQVIDWVILATHQAQRDHDIKVRLIAQIGRGEDVAVAWRVAEAAVAAHGSGLVGLDLAGNESAHSATHFVDVFRWAAAHGLHITIHAGEAGPASNIRQAIEQAGAQRIGHGVRAGDDPAVMQLLIERGVALEMCPTSNLHTGAVSALSDHPLHRYQAAGMPVTINTDNPSISNTTLTGEYRIAVCDLGITPSGLRQAIVQAATSAFLPETERRQLVAWFEQA